ncbi:MAG: hypothetical protein RJA56_1206 [Pseudomonadota bacterium]
MIGGVVAKSQTALNYSQRAEPGLSNRGLLGGVAGRIAPVCGCSSVDRVLASEAKGRGFDPRQPHHHGSLHSITTWAYNGRYGAALVSTWVRTRRRACRGSVTS